VVTEAEIRFDQAELWRDEGAGSLRGWMADHCGLGRRGAPAAAPPHPWKNRRMPQFHTGGPPQAA
jgi:hypothetical protein